MFTKIFFTPSSLFFLCSALYLICSVHVTAREQWEEQSVPGVGHLVKRDERQPLISSEFGQISGASVSDGNETFRLQFITLEPNSLFLPVMLHQDMVFYVHTGRGKLSYKDENKMENRTLRRGDVHRLESGTVFFVQSDLDPERQKLRVYAIFGNAGEDLRVTAAHGPYSSIRDLILGFDKKILQETFKVPEEVIEEITSGPKPEAIMQGLPSTKKDKRDREYEFIEGILGSRRIHSIFDISNKEKKKSNIYNIFHEKRDFENCNGWSTTVDRKKYSVLKDSKFGLFMVNLTHGGMMGPHWNPKATEIAIVLQGRGMIRIVCPSLVNETECKNARFEVEEGDVFVVPRFHPMAQMAFNNETFVFMGFSTSTKNNHPQYLAGKASVLRTLDKHILATSFGVNDTIFDNLLNQQGESVILECVSCAEEEWRIMGEEIEREREEARQREEEETRRREEERRRQEEEAKKREEEEARRREEEESKKREQEEEEAEARRREEEQTKKREEEEARRREEEEEAAQRKREEEEAQKRREQEEMEREEREKRQQEEAAEKRREQEEREARQREAEEARTRREQEEREQEQAAEREQKEREAAARREEEEARRQEEEAQRRQQQGGGGGGEGQQGGRRGEQPPVEEGRREGEAQREEEAAKQEEEEMGQAQQQGSGQGGRRRILKTSS